MDGEEEGLDAALAASNTQPEERRGDVPPSPPSSPPPDPAGEDTLDPEFVVMLAEQLNGAVVRGMCIWKGLVWDDKRVQAMASFVPDERKQLTRAAKPAMPFFRKYIQDTPEKAAIVFGIMLLTQTYGRWVLMDHMKREGIGVLPPKPQPKKDGRGRPPGSKNKPKDDPK